MPRNRMLLCPPSLGGRSGRLGMRRFEFKLAPITLERTRTVPEPHDGPLADRLRAPRVLRDQRLDHLAIPLLGVFHIQNGMDREVMSLLRRNAEPAQPAIHVTRARRSGHF